jgi:parallel beta-helix repeat protein
VKRIKLSAIILFTIFIALELNIHVEATLEHKPESISDSELNNDDNIRRDTVIVSKNDKSADYTSIQAAIESVQPGTTIYVKIGIYSEILDIKKQIKIIGEDKEQTIINPTTKENSYAILIAKEEVKLSELSITNQGSGLYTTGIKITAPRTIITQCNIYDTPVGIAIWSSQNTIQNCVFRGCQDEGIVLLGNPNHNCVENRIETSKFYGNCDGIELQYASYNFISNCIFYENSHAAIDAIGSDNNDNTISNCEFDNNDGFGIYLSKSTGNSIIKSSFIESPIVTRESTNNILQDCTLDSFEMVDHSCFFIDNCEFVADFKKENSEENDKISNEQIMQLINNNQKSHRLEVISKLLSHLTILRERFRSLLLDKENCIN